MAVVLPAADSLDAAFDCLPSGALPVLDDIEAFRVSGSGGTRSVLFIDDQPFRKILRIKTQERVALPYSFQAIAAVPMPLKKGDAMLAVFWARAVDPLPEDREAHTEFILELSSEPFTKSVARPISVGHAWQKYYVPFEVALDLPAGKSHAIFRAGYDPQTFDIGGFQLLNFKNIVPRAALPCTPSSYVGLEASAVWRHAANQRIEELRKAALRITVKDSSGQPVRGAKIAVRMTRHAFGFGTAVDAPILASHGADADRYRAVLQANFNKAVIENHLKWPQWERDRGPGLAAVGWLAQHGLAVRGHCLVWPGKTHLPTSAIALFDQPAALRSALLTHVHDAASSLRGQLVEWDVVNEPFTNTDLQRILGPAILSDVFKAARAADPSAKLFINDYSILEAGGRDTAHQDHYEATICELLKSGAPLDGIGIQGHFNENLTPIPLVLKLLDRYAAFHLPIQITEFDINTYDEALQADYTRDFLTAIFSHPSTSGFLVWGFWEQRHWIPNGAFYRADWSARPAAAVWRQLVFEEWWTTVEGVTDENGCCVARGFLGDYEVTVSAGASSRTEAVQLTKAGATLSLTI